MDLAPLKPVKEAKNLIEEIRIYRKKYHISQVELSQLVEISQPYLCKIEKGVSRDVPMEVVIRILRELGLAVYVGEI
jgi:predicted transcriptional regulator